MFSVSTPSPDTSSSPPAWRGRLLEHLERAERRLGAAGLCLLALLATAAVAEVSALAAGVALYGGPRLDLQLAVGLAVLIATLPLALALSLAVGGRHSEGTAEQAAAERDRLTAERDAAQAASHAKSDFLATLSHELRTPLNAILGFSGVMLAERFGPLGAAKYREYAADIQSSGAHLLALLNDILDMARIEAGKVQLDRTEIDLLPLVEASLRLVRQTAEARGVRLRVAVPRGLPPLHVDERATKQILINLLANAVRFTGEGGTVTVSARPAGDGFVVVAVSDTGIGIPEPDLARVREPFVQVEGRPGGGAGLGLPIASSLAELHGGRLDIRSTLGVGTTVEVRLPSGTPRPLRLAS